MQDNFSTIKALSWKAVALASLMSLPLAMSGAGTAQAYTPKWLECTGDMTVTAPGAQAATQPADDVYVTDDDARNLFKYSPDRKALSYIGVNSYTDGEIKWSGTGSGINLSTWDGNLNRSTSALNLTYKSGPEVRTWKESCKPTTPREEAKQ